MALRHAILAALLEGEASGYELSKRFDVSVANFWSATPQQLYRELERVTDEGLLAARVVEQQRRPNKHVFALTDAGRDELVAFTARPARPTAIRDELLVKLQAVDAGDTDAVMAAIAQRTEQSQAKLALYDRLREQLLAGRTEQDYLHRRAGRPLPHAHARPRVRAREPHLEQSRPQGPRPPNRCTEIATPAASPTAGPTPAAASAALPASAALLLSRELAAARLGFQETTALERQQERRDAGPHDRPDCRNRAEAEASVGAVRPHEAARSSWMRQRADGRTRCGIPHEGERGDVDAGYCLEVAPLVVELW